MRTKNFPNGSHIDNPRSNIVKKLVPFSNPLHPLYNKDSQAGLEVCPYPSHVDDKKGFGRIMQHNDDKLTQPAPTVRAKFKVESYETRLSGSGPDAQEIRSVKLSVVYGDSEENKKYFKWTPSGRIEMGMLGPEAWKAFELGKEMYVDFVPVAP